MHTVVLKRGEKTALLSCHTHNTWLHNKKSRNVVFTLARGEKKLEFFAGKTSSTSTPMGCVHHSGMILHNTNSCSTLSDKFITLCYTSLCLCLLASWWGMNKIWWSNSYQNPLHKSGAHMELLRSLCILIPDRNHVIRGCRETRKGSLETPKATNWLSFRDRGTPPSVDLEQPLTEWLSHYIHEMFSNLL